MDDEVKFIIKMLAIVFGITFSVAGVIWIVHSHFEVKAFNKFSTQKAALVDGMFLELRVVAEQD